MKVLRVFRPFLIVIIAMSIVTCQEEKFTDKGIPEVEVTLIKAIDGGGTLFEGRILFTGSDEILDHGFLWDTGENPLPGQASVVFLGPRSKSGSFSATVTSDIEKDKIYYARGFLITENHLSLSSVKSFTGGESIPPVLTSVSPNTAICGDTVIISGKNFSFIPANNMIWFGETEATVIYSTIDELVVKVPPTTEGPSKISLSVSGLQAKNMIDFTVLEPGLTSYFPLYGTFGDTLTLSGNYLCIDPLYARVYFNNKVAQILEISRTHYKVVVPPENNYSPAVIKIKYFNSFSYNELFNLKQAVITDISPTRVKQGGIIVITGENFNPVSFMNRVIIGGVDATVLHSTASEIITSVPSTLNLGTYSLSLTTIEGAPVDWTGTLEILTPWKRLSDFPGSGRASAAAFSVNGKGYLGPGHDVNYQVNDLWEYDPALDQWSPKQDSPLPGLVNGTGFSVSGYGYVTMGKIAETYNKKLIRYDPDNDIWESMTTKPGVGSSMKAPAFVIGNKAYVTEIWDLYEYDPETDNWTKKASVPEEGYFGSGAAFSIGNKGYFGIGWIHETSSNIRKFYEYDPVTNQWNRKADFPGELRNSSVFFSLPNGKGYVGLGTDSNKLPLNDFWEYDPVTDQWSRLDDFPGSGRISAMSFCIDNKAYVVSGYDGNYLNDLWEFNPYGLVK